MNLRALLLDLEGTLLDTNELHVEAWAAAFASRGYRVGRSRIAEVLDEDNHALIRAVLGADAERADGLAIVEAKHAALRRRVGRPIEPMRGARELLDAARARKLRIAIVSKSSREDTRLLEQSAGWSLAKEADAVVTREQLISGASIADTLASACDRLGEDPLACAFVADAREDADAARRDGIAFIGVTSGYADREALLRAGARYVAASAAELAAGLSEALDAASKIQVQLDGPTLSSMMTIALGAARDALGMREAPVGAALFSRTGELLSTGHNRACETRDRSLHAELDAFHALTRHGHSTDEVGILVSTLEPCVMCLGAAMEVGLDVVVFGLESPDDGGLERVLTPTSPENLLPRIRRGIRRAEARDLFVRWLAEVSTPSQRPFAESLVRKTGSDRPPPLPASAELGTLPVPLALGHRLPRAPRRRTIIPPAATGEKGPL